MNEINIELFSTPTTISRNYNLLINAPILNKDLSDESFNPVPYTYYRHTGSSTESFINGKIYFYNGVEYTAIDKTYLAGSGIYIVNNTIYAEVTREQFDLLSQNTNQNTNNINEILLKIPTQASQSNQLADKDFVNSSINAFAAFYITKDAEGNPFDTKKELDDATVFYNAGEVRIPTKNDYCIVLNDESKALSSGEIPTTRYSYQDVYNEYPGYIYFVSTTNYVNYYIDYNNKKILVTDLNKDNLNIVPGTTKAYTKKGQWEFQYIVNNSSLTADQLAAVNSGITSELVNQITINKNDITEIKSSVKNPIDIDVQLIDTQWETLSNKYPFSWHQLKTTSILNATEIELINNDAVLFANYGFAIGSVTVMSTGYIIDIYAVAKPSDTISLKVRYK